MSGFVQAFRLAQDAAANSIALPCTSLGAGNLLCGHLSWQVATGTADLTSITNATIVDRQLAGGFAQVSYYARNLAGGALTVTANFSSAVAFRRIQNSEYSGLDTSASVLNAHVQNQSAAFGTGANAVTSTAATTTLPGCTIVGFAYDDTSTTLPTAGTSFTARDGFTNAAGDCLIGEERVQATAGSIAATFNTTAGTDQIFVSMLAFAPATSVLATTASVGPGVQAGARPLGQFRTAPRSSDVIGSNVTISLTGLTATFTEGQISASGGDIKFGQIPQPGPGIGPFSNNQFLPGLRSAASAVANTAVSLTGQTATFTLGTITPTISYALSGQTATFTEGTPLLTASYALAAQTAAFTEGVLASNIAYALTGQSGTFSEGALTPAVDYALTQQTATFTEGTITAQASGDVTIQLSGLQAVFALGQITATGADAPPVILTPAGALLPGYVPDELGQGMGPYKRPGQVFGVPDPVSPFLTARASDVVPLTVPAVVHQVVTDTPRIVEAPKQDELLMLALAIVLHEHQRGRIS